MTDAPTLVDLGWNDRLAALATLEEQPEAHPGRVSRVDLGISTVLTEHGAERAGTPMGGGIATGDWVLIEDEQVVAVLPRTSTFTRGDPMDGAARDEQVVAANIDTVFILHPLTTGPNLRRLERELVLVYESGAMPLVVLSKADLVDATDEAQSAVEALAPGLESIVTSTMTGDGIDELRTHAAAGQTVALIGASGAGKSTLVNALVGNEVQATGDVRAGDQRGRHTTTARELVPIPGGGVLIDTPGLRAVSLWDADEGLSRVFADIEALAATCKFSDCAHESEPGCAVLAAIERGALDPARLDSYKRLDEELDKTARRREGRELSKAIKQMYKIRPDKSR
ncbi:MAG: ribosome small subunit-dependent GTPase A [Acidimicrobiia bacterium]